MSGFPDKIAGYIGNYIYTLKKLRKLSDYKDISVTLF